MASSSRNNGKVVPFRKPNRSSKARLRRFDFGFSPIMVILPLAAFAAVFMWDGGPKGWASTSATSGAGSRNQISAQFSTCNGPVRVTCVVDGDTFWLNGSKVRIADINTPEVSDPACSEEAQLGAQATLRLAELLNEAPFSLVSVERERDIHGRLLRKLMRDGRSIGNILVAEGLAEPWQGRRSSWCS